METRINYAVVGAFVVALTLAMIVVIVWLSSGLTHVRYERYVSYMEESVAGLTPDSPVRYNGVPVGSVREIDLDPSDPKRVRVSMDIARGTPILTSTTATLQLQGITGLVYVALQTDNSNSPALVVQQGQRYPVIASRPSLLVRLDTALSDFTSHFDQIAQSITQILSQENSDAITKSLHNVESITSRLDEKMDAIQQTVDYAQQTFKNTADASEKVPGLIDRLDAATQSIDDLSQQLQHTAVTLNSTLASGRVTLNSMSEQLIPQAVRTLMGVNRMTDNFTDLTTELRQDPSILIRGRTPPAAGPGEQPQ